MVVVVTVGGGGGFGRPLVLNWPVSQLSSGGGKTLSGFIREQSAACSGCSAGQSSKHSSEEEEDVEGRE